MEDRKQLARLAQLGERNPLLKRKVGLLDQTASLSPGSVMIGYGNMSITPVANDMGRAALVAIKSGIEHDLGEESAYAQRVKETGEAPIYINRILGIVQNDPKAYKHVAAVPWEEFQKVMPRIEELEKKKREKKISDTEDRELTCLKRARHQQNEKRLTPLFVQEDMKREEIKQELVRRILSVRPEWTPRLMSPDGKLQKMETLEVIISELKWRAPLFYLRQIVPLVKDFYSSVFRKAAMLNASGDSMSETGDFQISGMVTVHVDGQSLKKPAMDILVNEAGKIRRPGFRTGKSILGIRMMGGGMGGSAIGYVWKKDLSHFKKALGRSRYTQETGFVSEVLELEVYEGGARTIWRNGEIVERGKVEKAEKKESYYGSMAEHFIRRMHGLDLPGLSPSQKREIEQYIKKKKWEVSASKKRGPPITFEEKGESIAVSLPEDDLARISNGEAPESLDILLLRFVLPLAFNPELPSSFKESLDNLEGDLFAAVPVEKKKSLYDTWLRLRKSLEADVYFQDQRSREFSFLPTSFEHLIDTGRNMELILAAGEKSGLKEQLESRYGNRYREILHLLALMHDIGYRVVDPADPDTYNLYKAETERMVKEHYWSMIEELLAGDIAQEEQQSEVKKDFLAAIRYQRGQKRARFDKENPLLFVLTLAKELDVTHHRLEPWQKRPWYLEILERIQTDDRLIELTADLQWIQSYSRLIESAGDAGEVKDILRVMLTDAENSGFDGGFRDKADLLMNSRDTKLKALAFLRDEYTRIQREHLKNSRELGEKLLSQYEGKVPQDELESARKSFASISSEGYYFFAGAVSITDLNVEFRDGTWVITFDSIDHPIEYGYLLNMDFLTELLVDRVRSRLSYLMGSRYVKNNIQVNIRKQKARDAMYRYIESLPLAETHAHINGSVPFYERWRQILNAEKAVDWNAVKMWTGKSINEVLRENYGDPDIDLNRIVELAKQSRKRLIESVSIYRGEFGKGGGYSRDEDELLYEVKKIMFESDRSKTFELKSVLQSYKFYMLYLHKFKRFVEYVNLEGRLEEFVTSYEVGKSITLGKTPEETKKFARQNARSIAHDYYDHGVRYMELRVSLAKTAEDTALLLEGVIQGLKDAEKEITREDPGEIGLETRIIVTFEKRGLKPSNPYGDQARMLCEILSAHPGIREKVIGIDFAGPEEGTPPRLFREIFEVIGEYNKKEISSNRAPLRATYHVGEGFTDVSLITALRYVDDVLDFDSPGVSIPRIGHGLILGLTYEKYAGSVSFPERLSERITTLEWLLAMDQAGKISLKPI
ncbi:MAG TPA: hypothetical protein VJC03_08165, partial [bacterium]|nr:hypothetical protein [bacterium]